MIKISAKQVKETFPRILAVPYCAAQNLLRFRFAPYYTAGKNGKTSAIYVFDLPLTAVSTGYEPMGQKSRFVDKYEAAAKEVWDTNSEISVIWEKLNKIIAEWLQEEFSEG